MKLYSNVTEQQVDRPFSKALQEHSVRKEMKTYKQNNKTEDNTVIFKCRPISHNKDSESSTCAGGSEIKTKSEICLG